MNFVSTKPTDILHAVRELAQKWPDAETISKWSDAVYDVRTRAQKPGQYPLIHDAAQFFLHTAPLVTKLLALADRAEAESQREGQQGQWLPKDGDRVGWTNMIGEYFTGTLKMQPRVDFDDGSWRMFLPSELRDLRQLPPETRT